MTHTQSKRARLGLMAVLVVSVASVSAVMADENYVDIGVLKFEDQAAVVKTEKTTKAVTMEPIVDEPTFKVDMAPATGNGPIVYNASVQSRIEAFRRAMVEADTDVLEALADDQMNFGHSNGVVQTKQEFIDMVRNGDEVFLSLDLGKKTLERTGNLSVERHKFISDIIIEGKTISVELEVLEVWRNGPEGWRLVARQAYKT